jgi:hypothetical protein
MLSTSVVSASFWKLLSYNLLYRKIVCMLSGVWKYPQEKKLEVQGTPSHREYYLTTLALGQCNPLLISINVFVRIAYL